MEEDKTTPKKNQHFVPRFYLKRFSVLENGRELRLFSKKLEKFISRASLSSQASNKFYYGKDGELENDLAKSESIFARVIGNIIETEALPKYGSRDHLRLLHFAVMTEYRNPIKRVEMEKITEILGGYLKQYEKLPEKYRNEEFQLRLSDPVAFALKNQNKSVLMITDLHIKLIRNETDIPFITSDNPVVQYNQFLEHKTPLEAITGYGVKGIQIFIPISTRYMLVLFDSQIYYLGKRKSKVIRVTRQFEIDQLNMLQVMNSDQMVYGNEKINEEYLKNLFEMTKKFTSPRKELSQKTQTGERTFLVYHGATSCRIKLNLGFVALSTHAERIDFSQRRMVYPREHAMKVADAIKNDPRII
jgi:hypothetical protein